MLILRRIDCAIFHFLKIAVLLETQEAGSTGDYGLQAWFPAIKQKDKRSYNKDAEERKAECRGRDPSQVTISQGSPGPPDAADTWDVRSFFGASKGVLPDQHLYFKTVRQ